MVYLSHVVRVVVYVLWYGLHACFRNLREACLVCRLSFFRMEGRRHAVGAPPKPAAWLRALETLGGLGMAGGRKGCARDAAAVA